MKKLFLPEIWFLLIFSLLVISCTSKNGRSNTMYTSDAKYKSKLIKSNPESFYKLEDSTLYLFADSDYQVKFHITRRYYDQLGSYEGVGERNNAVLKFIHKSKRAEKLLFADSLSCMSAVFDIRDFNNDGVKDLEVFHFDGARSNPRYYLYLINQKNKKLTRVKGFEEIPNAGLDSINNIIVGLALYGDNVDYSFHRINNAGKLVKLHKQVTDTINGTKSDAVIRQIVKQLGR